MNILVPEIEARLRCVLGEVEGQEDVSACYSPESLPFAEEMEQIHEYIEIAGEYGIAYETLVATIEAHHFLLSGKAAICLLELGLLFRYKTDRKEDALFDLR